MKYMFYIYRTRRESRGAVEVWVNVDGRGESGIQGGAALAGELEGGPGDRDPQQHFGASNWMVKVFNFFLLQFCSRIAFRSPKF